MLKDPALPIEKLAAYASGKACKQTKEKLPAFHDRLVADYGKEFPGIKNVLFKMKELWSYLIVRFQGERGGRRRYEKRAGRIPGGSAAGIFGSGCSFFSKKKGI